MNKRKWIIGFLVAGIFGLLNAGAGLLGDMGWKSFVAVLCSALITNLGAYLMKHPIEEIKDDEPAGTLRSLLFCFLLFTLFMSGCKNPEVTAYRSLGTIATMVDGAMNGWGDYVRGGYATDEQQATVRNVYEHYQQAMRVAKLAEVTAKNAPDGQNEYVTAVQAVAAAADDIVAIVRSFMKTQPKPLAPPARNIQWNPAPVLLNHQLSTIN